MQLATFTVVYSPCVTALTSCLTGFNDLLGTSRRQTNSGKNSMQLVNQSTTASGVCPSTRTTGPRFIPLTLTFATCVAIVYVTLGCVVHLTNFFKLGGKPGGSCTAALFLKAFVDGIEPKEAKTSLPCNGHILTLQVQWRYVAISY